MIDPMLPQSSIAFPTPKASVHLEALYNYLKMGNTFQAFDQAYGWIKDGTLNFTEWQLFVKAASAELVQFEKRQEMYRG